MLKRLSPEQVRSVVVDAVSREALEAVSPIVAAVREQGMTALKKYAAKLDGWKGEALVLERGALEEAFSTLPRDDQALLERCAARVSTFAQAQRASLQDCTVMVPGGRSGHVVSPVQRAACYVPGGRYPLPSSMLMTVCTAKAAGVPRVWAASPRRNPYTLGAAFVAGADVMLAAGGAQAIAALAYGCGEIEACDVVTGPGNAYVTAAKFLVSQHVRIDMLAGPSELLIIADETADPQLVAADLVAQAEHGPDSLPVLLSLSEELLDRVDYELGEQVALIAGRAMAESSLSKGYACVCRSLPEAAEISERLAPEHLQLMIKDPAALRSTVRNYGGLFVGSGSAEVLGDYCVGPNHTLPTGGISRGRGGLSVLDFSKVQTWLEIDSSTDARALYLDAARLGAIEGLEGHGMAARLRVAE